jgi:amino acid transporter
MAAAAAISNALTAYLAYFWLPLGSGAGRILAITILLFGLAWLNLLGIRYGAWTVNLLTAAKLIPLSLFICVGLFAVDHRAYELLAFPNSGGLRRAALF